MNTFITIPEETIISKIQIMRGKKVMLDRDLANIYGVENRSLNQAVKRNIYRFPPDFMFQLSKDEVSAMVSQSVIPSLQVLGGNQPKAFTEQGVAMLSSILNSDRAIQVNIRIIRTFTKLRELLADNKKITTKIEQMERKYDRHIFQIFQIIKKLTAIKNKPLEFDKPKDPIGFKSE